MENADSHSLVSSVKRQESQFVAEAKAARWRVVIGCLNPSRIAHMHLAPAAGRIPTDITHKVSGTRRFPCPGDPARVRLLDPRFLGAPGRTLRHIVVSPGMPNQAHGAPPCA